MEEVTELLPFILLEMARSAGGRLAVSTEAVYDLIKTDHDYQLAVTMEPEEIIVEVFDETVSEETN